MCLVTWSISFILGFGRAFVRRWLCPIFGFQLVSRSLAGYILLLLYWLPLFGACSRRCGSCRPPEFPVFLLACLCSLPVLGFLLVSWFVVGYTLLCSSAGCRCSAPTPGAAALAGLLSFASVYGRFGVVASSWIWGAFCALAPAVCLAPAGFLTMAWRC